MLRVFSLIAISMLCLWNTLSTADRINVTIAIGTAIASIAAACSAWLARRTVRDAVRQMQVQLAEFRAQTFLSILAYEREIHFSRHMDVIRTLGGKLAVTLNEGERESILVVVNFLNHVAHLIRHGYVVPKQLFLLYAPSIAVCRANLLGENKWLDELRRQKKEHRYYLHFEILCRQQTERLIWEDQADKIGWPTPATTPFSP